MNRRTLLQLMGGAAATLAAPRENVFAQKPQAPETPPAAVADEPTQYGPDETRMMDDIEGRAAHYFYEQADPSTGLIFDRAPAIGRGQPHIGIGSSYQQQALTLSKQFKR